MRQRERLIKLLVTQLYTTVYISQMNPVDFVNYDGNCEQTDEWISRHYLL